MFSISKAPFKLGDYLPGTDLDGNLINQEWLGQRFVVQPSDMAYTAAGRNIRLRRHGTPLHVVIMRNSSGGALLPTYVVSPDASAADADPTGIGVIPFLGRVSGKVGTKGKIGLVVDEFLPAAGVPDKALFFCVYRGIVTVRMPATANYTTDPAVGSLMVAQADGRAVVQDASTVAAALDQTCNLLGRALRATTSANDGGTLLIYASVNF